MDGTSSGSMLIKAMNENLHSTYYCLQECDEILGDVKDLLQFAPSRELPATADHAGFASPGSNSIDDVPKALIRLSYNSLNDIGKEVEVNEVEFDDEDDDATPYAEDDQVDDSENGMRSMHLSLMEKQYVPTVLDDDASYEYNSDIEEWENDEDAGYVPFPVSEEELCSLLQLDQEVPSQPEEENDNKQETSDDESEKIKPPDADEDFQSVNPDDNEGDSKPDHAEETEKEISTKAWERSIRIDEQSKNYGEFNLRVIYELHRTGLQESKSFKTHPGMLIAGRYEVCNMVGEAAFSTAIKCYDTETEKHVCIKVIKNDKDFLDQSIDEIILLEYINSNCDDVDAKCVLRLYDYFYHKEHLFLVCELLRDNLYELSKYITMTDCDSYLTVDNLRRISTQVLTAFQYVHGLGIIHCDVKPENILIKSFSKVQVKLIDFGSSCFTSDNLTSYIQSRSYRAPEVILGLKYDQTIDIWSLGCVLVELFTGQVLFNNDSIQTLLARLIGILGPLPKHMIDKSCFKNRYFTSTYSLYDKQMVNSHHEEENDDDDYNDKADEEYVLLFPKQSSIKHRLKTSNPLFLDFIKQLLTVDPDHRPTAEQALQHPFLLEEPLQELSDDDSCEQDERELMHTVENQDLVQEDEADLFYDS